MTENIYILEPAEVLAQTIAILDQLRVDYFLTGSLASSVHGEFRATNDIDIVAALNVDSAKKLALLASQYFFADEQSIERAVLERRSFNIIHKRTVIKVDFFTRIDELARHQLARATLVKVPGTDCLVKVATAEDVILAKLIWYRKGGEQSERQWRDITGVVEVSAVTLDHNYLTSWCDKLGLQDLLNKALAQAPG